jgi:pyruvate dehydrogenase E2 component (dihydrolipoamide acetyltransferase)
MEKLPVGGTSAPPHGSGIGGRVLASDITPGEGPVSARPGEGERVTEIPVTGIRRIIAGRMRASLQSTAQLTLNASADASRLLAYRKRLKESPEQLGLQNVALNAIVLFVTARTLARYPEMNALYTGEKIMQYENVHLAFAVDTPRGLIVPVIHDAHRKSLKELSDESGRLARECIEGNVNPDALTGGTFTVTNLGSLGIESFTPVLNTPQVGILGVGAVTLRPVERDGNVEFVPHMGLSLTIDHQVVDGAPAARFLQDVCQGLAETDVILAT